jgi:hypothetical protein
MAAKQLEDAFKEASKLPEREQESIGSWLLLELRSDRRWAKAFRASEGKLSKLAHEALDDHNHGLSEDLDPDKL